MYTNTLPNTLSLTLYRDGVSRPKEDRSVVLIGVGVLKGISCSQHDARPGCIEQRLRLV